MRARALAPCLAILTALLPSAVAGAVPARAARPASGTICVALVVDFTTLGGSVESGCETVPKGSTGTDVLQSAGHRLTICSDGIIGAVDGRPADGCRTKDSTHYWSYWHRAPGSSRWVYSSEGAGSYEPANASTDGWIWQDGGSTNQAPAAVPYDEICRPSPSPSPSPAATESHRHRHRSGSAAAGVEPSPAPTAPAAAPATGTPTADAHHRAATRRGTTAGRAAPDRQRAAPTSAPPSAPTSAPASPPGDEATPAARRGLVGEGADESSGPPWGVVAGVGVLLLIGTGAALRDDGFRRRVFRRGWRA